MSSANIKFGVFLCAGLPTLMIVADQLPVDESKWLWIGAWVVMGSDLISALIAHFAE